MYQPKKGDEADNPGASDDITAPPLKPFSRKGSHAPTKPPSAASLRPEIPRYPVEGAGLARRPESGLGGAESRRLVVGRDICIKGEITSCDKLVVEGRVEATLADARVIEIASTGHFLGDAIVDEAYISGCFEGHLTVRDKLTVRAGGLITGSVRYGSIVIESGGEVSGDMQSLAHEGEATAEAEASAPQGPAEPETENR